MRKQVTPMATIYSVAASPDSVSSRLLWLNCR